MLAFFTENTTIRSDGDRVEESTLSGITLFFFAYILLLLTGTLVVAWDDVPREPKAGPTLLMQVREAVKAEVKPTSSQATTRVPVRRRRI